MGAFSIGQVRRSLLHFMFGKGAGAVLGLLLLLLLVRVLSTSDYGFYIASLALLELGAQWSSFGVVSAAQRYLPEALSRGEGRRLKRLAWFLSFWRIVTLVAAAALIYAAANTLASVAGMSRYAGILQLFLLVFLAESLARFLDVVFDSLLLQGISQVSLLLRSGIRVIGLLVLSGGGTEYISISEWIIVDTFAALAGCVWGLGALWWFTRRQARREAGPTDRLEVRRYAKFSLQSYVAASLYTLSGPNSVKLIAVRLLSPTGYAAFGFASTLAATVQRYLPLFLLIGMIRPLFVAAREKPDFMRRLPAMASLVLKLNVFFLLPIGVFVAIAGHALAEKLTGGRYPEAGVYLFAFVVLLLAQALRGVVSLMAQAMEDARAPLLGTALGLIGIVVGVLLAGPMGGIGLCVGMVLSEVIFAGSVMCALSRRQVAFVSDWPAYFRMALATLVAAVLTWLAALAFDVQSAGGMAVVALSACVTFFGVAYVWKPFALQERETVNRLLNRRVFVW